MDKLQAKLEKANDNKQNAIKKEAITPKKNESMAKDSISGEKVSKTPKKGVKPMKKTESKVKTNKKGTKLVGQARALGILQKVAKATKGVHLSGNGAQIIDDQTAEIKCSVCRHMAKVTMPLPRKDGVRPCESNRHMSWIPFDHKDLEKLFKGRVASKKTMLQFEADVYEGAPSPARAKAMKHAMTAEDRVKAVDKKIAELQALKKTAQSELKAKKAKSKKAKGTTKAKATA